VGNPSGLGCGCFPPGFFALPSSKLRVVNLNLRWLCVLGLVAFQTGCISKGDTQITNAAQSGDDDDSEESEADAGGSDTQDSTLPATPSSDEEPEPGPATEPVDSAGPSSTPSDDDTMMSSEPTASSSEPPVASSSAPTNTGGANGTTPEPEPEPESTPSGGSGGDAPVEVPSVACALSSGNPLLGSADTLTPGDVVDKEQFAVAAGPSEHLVVWIDKTSNAPALGWLTVDEAGPTGVAYVDFQAETPMPQAYLAAVYSAEANSSQGAYALAWKNSSSVQFNWLAAGDWVLEAPSDYSGEFTVPYVNEDGIALAYDGSNYGIVPLAQHPYLMFVSPTGSNSIASPAPEQFTRQEARDVLVDDNGNFVTVGRYHNGSVSSPVQIITSFDAGAGTGTSTIINAETLLFQNFDVGDLGPKGIELVWDGAAVGVAYGGDAKSAGLHYARVTLGGNVTSTTVPVARNLTPLDAWFDAESGVVYVLSTDGGNDVYFVGVNATNGEVIVENAVVAAGSGITEGYLFWDEQAGRHRAYFASEEGSGRSVAARSELQVKPTPVTQRPWRRRPFQGQAADCLYVYPCTEPMWVPGGQHVACIVDQGPSR
jgi:hypothetical protein